MLSRARWGEYRGLLLAAVRAGYRVVPLERWVLEPDGGSEPVIVLRHDVDQHPRTALRMARIERDLGLRSTYYFRWRTADGRVISRLRDWGFEVGLHYETLTRAALHGDADPRDQALLSRCHEELAREVRAFSDLHGEVRSVCPHGDSRVPGANNAVLLAGADPSSLGIAFDTDAAMRGRELGAWLTDRSPADGGWSHGSDPLALIGRRASPILCVTHPHHWCSGAALWADRLLGSVVPAPMARPARTRSDEPPRRVELVGAT